MPGHAYVLEGGLRPAGDRNRGAGGMVGGTLLPEWFRRVWNPACGERSEEASCRADNSIAIVPAGCDYPSECPGSAAGLRSIDCKCGEPETSPDTGRVRRWSNRSGPRKTGQLRTMSVLSCRRLEAQRHRPLDPLRFCLRSCARLRGAGQEDGSHGWRINAQAIEAGGLALDATVAGHFRFPSGCLGLRRSACPSGLLRSTTDRTRGPSECHGAAYAWRQFRALLGSAVPYPKRMRAVHASRCGF